jgi:hypothetical protein
MTDRRAGRIMSTGAAPLAPRHAALLFSVLFPSLALAQDEAEEIEYYEPGAVHDAAEDVFSSPEFRNLPRLDLGPGGAKTEPLKSKKELEQQQATQPQGSSRAAGPLADLIASMFGGAMTMVVVAVLVVVLGAIAALIVLGIRRWERTEKKSTDGPSDDASDEETEGLVTPGDRPADAWLAAARSAAAAGRFDEALALLLLGAMAHAERAGLIRPRRGLTYRDYLRAVPESSAWHRTLDRLIRAYAPVGFGRRAASADAFEAMVGPYEAALAAEPTPGAPASGLSTVTAS